MTFEIIGNLDDQETIASGAAVKVRAHLTKARGPGRTMKPQLQQFAPCLENTGNEASLVLGKVYHIVPDAQAAKDELVRIIDESGEDYLFPRRHFALVDFPRAVRRRILALQKVDRPARTRAPKHDARRRRRLSSGV